LRATAVRIKLGALHSLLILAIQAFAGCASSVSTNYGRGIDFSLFKTYQWRDVRPTQDAAVEDAIRGAVDAALASKGLRKVNTGAQLWVVEHTRLSEQARVNTYDSGWGYSSSWGWGGGTTEATASEVRVGDLLVDLVDASDRSLIWRGSASRTVDPHASPAVRDAAIADAVRQMFAGYPPSR